MTNRFLDSDVSKESMLGAVAPDIFSVTDAISRRNQLTIAERAREQLAALEELAAIQKENDEAFFNPDDGVMGTVGNTAMGYTHGITLMGEAVMAAPSSFRAKAYRDRTTDEARAAWHKQKEYNANKSELAKEKAALEAQRNSLDPSEYLQKAHSLFLQEERLNKEGLTKEEQAALDAPVYNLTSIAAAADAQRAAMLGDTSDEWKQKYIQGTQRQFLAASEQIGSVAEAIRGGLSSYTEKAYNQNSSNALMSDLAENAERAVENWEEASKNGSTLEKASASIGMVFDMIGSATDNLTGVLELFSEQIPQLAIGGSGLKAARAAKYGFDVKGLGFPLSNSAFAVESMETMRENFIAENGAPPTKEEESRIVGLAVLWAAAETIGDITLLDSVMKIAKKTGVTDHVAKMANSNSYLKKAADIGVGAAKIVNPAITNTLTEGTTEFIQTGIETAGHKIAKTGDLSEVTKEDVEEALVGAQAGGIIGGGIGAIHSASKPVKAAAVKAATAEAERQQKLATEAEIKANLENAENYSEVVNSILDSDTDGNHLSVLNDFATNNKDKLPELSKAVFDTVSSRLDELTEEKVALEMELEEAATQEQNTPFGQLGLKLEEDPKSTRIAEIEAETARLIEINNGIHDIANQEQTDALNTLLDDSKSNEDKQGQLNLIFSENAEGQVTTSTRLTKEELEQIQASNEQSPFLTERQSDFVKHSIAIAQSAEAFNEQTASPSANEVRNEMAHGAARSRGGVGKQLGAVDYINIITGAMQMGNSSVANYFKGKLDNFVSHQQAKFRVAQRMINGENQAEAMLAEGFNEKAKPLFSNNRVTGNLLNFIERDLKMLESVQEHINGLMQGSSSTEAAAEAQPQAEAAEVESASNEDTTEEEEVNVEEDTKQVAERFTNELNTPAVSDAELDFLASEQDQDSDINDVIEAQLFDETEISNTEENNESSEKDVEETQSQEDSESTELSPVTEEQFEAEDTVEQETEEHGSLTVHSDRTNKKRNEVFGSLHKAFSKIVDKYSPGLLMPNVTIKMTEMAEGVNGSIELGEMDSSGGNEVTIHMDNKLAKVKPKTQKETNKVLGQELQSLAHEYAHMFTAVLWVSNNPAMVVIREAIEADFIKYKQALERTAKNPDPIKASKAQQALTVYSSEGNTAKEWMTELLAQAVLNEANEVKGTLFGKLKELWLKIYNPVLTAAKEIADQRLGITIDPARVAYFLRTAGWEESLWKRRKGVAGLVGNTTIASSVLSPNAIANLSNVRALSTVNEDGSISLLPLGDSKVMEFLSNNRAISLFFKAKQKGDGLLNKVKDFYSAWSTYGPSLLSHFNIDTKLSQEETIYIIESMLRVADGVRSTFDTYIKKGSVGKQHSIYDLRNFLNQFFDEKTGLPYSNNLYMAFSVGISKWMAEKADEVGRVNRENYESLYGIDSKSLLPYEYEKLPYGVTQQTLVEELGKAVYQQLGMTTTELANNGDAKQVMVHNLGLAALAAMVQGNLLKETTGEIALTPSMFHQVKNVRSVDQLVASKGEANVAAMRFYAPTYSLKAEGVELGNIGKVLSSVFASELDPNKHVFEKPKEKKSRKVYRTDQNVPNDVNTALNNSDTTPQVLKQDLWRVLKALGKDFSLALAGYTEVPKIIHKAQEESLEGKNKSALSNVESTFEMIEAMEQQEEGLSTPIYHLSNAWKMLRLGMRGLSNPQSNKYARSLMSRAGATYPIDLSNSEQTGLVNMFLVAVAQGLDIKVDKQYDEKSIEELEKLMETQLAQEAIAEMFKVIDGEPANQSKIKAFLSHKDVGAFSPHGFEALFNYAKYHRAKQGTHGTRFVSNISFEIDGITNGTAIGSIQLFNGESIEECIENLRRVGIYAADKNGNFIEKNYSNYKAKNNLDQYETLGKLWGEATAFVVQMGWGKFHSAVNPVKAAEIMQALTATRVNGITVEPFIPWFFKEDAIGVLASSARKLAKNPTMVTTYGASVQSVINALARSIEDNIYSALSEAAQKNDPRIVESLNIRLKMMGLRTQFDTNNLANNLNRYIYPSDVDVLTGYTLGGYKEAFEQAIEKVSGSMFGARDAMNALLSLKSVKFSKLFDAEVGKLIQQRIEEGNIPVHNGQAVFNLSKEDFDLIKEKLLKQQPLVKSFLSNDDFDSIFLGATGTKVGNKDNSFRQPVISFNVNTEGNKVQYYKLRSADGKSYSTSLSKHIHTTISQVTYGSAGVSPIVLMIQSLDAAVMALFYKKAAKLGLGVHDAVVTDPKNALEVHKVLNEAFLEVMRGNSLIESVLDSFYEGKNPNQIKNEYLGLFNGMSNEEIVGYIDGDMGLKKLLVKYDIIKANHKLNEDNEIVKKYQRLVYKLINDEIAKLNDHEAMRQQLFAEYDLIFDQYHMNVPEGSEVVHKASGAPKNIWHSTKENAELSNLALRPFEYDGNTYHSVEHAYQTLKSGTFDEDTYNNEKWAKGGVKIVGKLKADHTQNEKLMYELVKASFEQNPEATNKLLATGNSKLTHTQDNGIWKKAFPRILTKVRTELKDSSQLDEELPSPEVETKAENKPTKSKRGKPIFDALDKKIADDVADFAENKFFPTNGSAAYEAAHHFIGMIRSGKSWEVAKAEVERIWYDDGNAYEQGATDLFDYLDKNPEVKETIKAIEDGNNFDELFATSGSSEVELDEANFQNAAQQITSGNLVQTFDRMGNLGHVTENPMHSNTLKRLVAAIAGSMNRFGLSTMELLETVIGNDENRGMQKGTTLFVQHGTGSGVTIHGSQMSSQEVFTHELVHALFNNLLDLFPRQRKVVQRIHHNLLDMYRRGEITGKDLAKNPNDPVEVTAAQNRLDYIFGRKDSGTTTNKDNSSTLEITHNRSKYLAEMVAFGLTNQKFRELLDSAKVNERPSIQSLKKVWGEGNTILEKLQNLLGELGALLTDYFYNPTRISSKDALDNAIYAIMQVEDGFKAKLINAIESTLTIPTKVIGKGLGVANKGIKAVVSSDIVANSSVATVRHLGKTVRVIVDVAPDSLSAPIDEIFKSFEGKRMSFFQDIYNDVRGERPDNYRVFSFLRASNKLVDQARKDINIIVGKAVKKLVEGLTKEQEAIMTQIIMRSDLQSLKLRYSNQEIRDMIRDPAVLTAEIAKLRQAIVAAGKQHNSASINEILRQTEALGVYLAHEVNNGNLSGLNAKQISNASLTYRNQPDSQAFLDQVQPLINELATLESLRFTALGIRQQAAAIFDEWANQDPDETKFESLLFMASNAVTRSKNMVFKGNDALMVKGYTKDTTNPHKGIQIAKGDPATVAMMESQGYELVTINGAAKALPVDRHDPVKEQMFVYVNKHAGLATLSAGGIAYTSNESKGSDALNKQSQLGQTGIGALAAANAANTQFNANKQGFINNRWNQSFKETPATTNKPYLSNGATPVIGPNGNIVGFRYLPTAYLKDQILDRDNRITTVMSATYSSVLGKVNSETINKKAVEVIAEQFDYDMKEGNSNKIVRIKAGSTDPKLREIYNLLPDQLKKDAYAKFGRDGIPIRKDLVDVMFGQRKASLVEAYAKVMGLTKTEQNMLQKHIHEMAMKITNNHLVNYLNIAEKGTRELVSIGKDIIVVKLGTVTLGNLMSNVVLLKMCGVPLKDIIKDQAEAWANMNTYQKLKASHDALEIDMRVKETQRAFLQAQGKSTVAIDKEINEMIKDMEILKEDIAANPISELIDAGVLQSIVEDLENEEDIYSYKSEMMQKMEKVGKYVPTPIVNIGKTILMTHDTRLYKFMNNAVRASDFIARYALHKHNLNNGMSKEDSIRDVVKTFINFDIPTNRWVQFANDMGLLWFIKYTMRVIAVVTNKFASNPAEVTSIMLSQMLFGDVSDPIDSIGIDPWMNKFGLPWSGAVNVLDIPTIDLPMRAL